MTIVKAIILGIIQGLTEFLPVSSSGHLAIAQNILKVDGNNALFFATMLHFGTLIAILIVYRKDVMNLLKEFFLVLYELITGKGLNLDKSPYRKLGLCIIIATIPTGLIGYTFSDFFSTLFVTQIAVGIGLVITGTLLWVSERVTVGTKDIKKMRYTDALLVGIFQSIAIAPGISRSGSTIVGSLFRGLNKELTVKFSFLISLPAIIGATIFELGNGLNQGLGGITTLMIGVGILAAALSGYIAIKSMIALVIKNKLHYFSYYTWLIGIIIIIKNII